MGFLENKFNKDITGVNKDSKERPIRGNGLYNGRYGTLPLPTTEPVNAEQYYRFLNYNPEDGGGDIGNYIRYGDPRDIINEAEEAARQLLPRDKEGKPYKGFDDAQDAVRHALGSYLLVKKYGVDVAKEITDGHERTSFPLGYIGLDDDNRESELQDLYNNRVGRDAAMNKKNKNLKTADIIMKLYQEGKLQHSPFVLKR